VGTYKLDKTRVSLELSSSVREKDPSIKLDNDGTTILTNVPVLAGFGDRVICRLAGGAKWELASDLNVGAGWSVAFGEYRPDFKSVQQECYRTDSWWGMLVLSIGTRHTGSTRLWETLTPTPAWSSKKLLSSPGINPCDTTNQLAMGRAPTGIVVVPRGRHNL
jgi:hypothetical protein